MMESMAQELAPKRIRVNAIAPGAIRTPINTAAWDTKEAYDAPDDAGALWADWRARRHCARGGVACLGSFRLRGWHDAVRRWRHDALSRALQQAGEEQAMSDRYDVIIIGSGPGGASVAHKLAPTGKRILLLERGDYLPRSPANWDSQTVFVDAAYQAKETWYGADGRSFHPGLHYFVGGNSKVYGAALFRMRERDFDEIIHKDGVSPAWPLKYDCSLSPIIRKLNGSSTCTDSVARIPTEPPSSGPFPYPAVSHEPQIQALSDSLTRGWLAPVPSAVGNTVGRKRRQADADQHLYPVRCFRRVSMFAQWKGGCAGDVRRSGAESVSQSDVVDRRLCLEAGDLRIR